MAYERPIDPHWLGLADGAFSQAFSVEDEYFAEDKDESEGLELDALVESLPEDQATCVQYRAFGQLSYRQIAEEMGWYTAGEPDGKKAWRYTNRGLRKLREKLDAAV